MNYRKEKEIQRDERRQNKSYVYYYFCYTK